MCEPASTPVSVTFAWPATTGTSAATTSSPSVKVTDPVGAPAVDPTVAVSTTLPPEGLVAARSVVVSTTSLVLKLLVAAWVATPQAPPSASRASWRKPEPSMSGAAASEQMKPAGPKTAWRSCRPRSVPRTTL